MIKSSQKRWLIFFAMLSYGLVALAADLNSLCADRAAMERVHYNHRLGEKPPFEQVLPPAILEDMVRLDLRKEAVLKKSYGVTITSALLDAEVQRINTTTRAPDVLAEIKTALGNDAVRFATVFAKPILVERLLREKFDNDDALHAPQRREMERIRTDLTNSAAIFRARRDMVPTNALTEKLVALLRQNHSNEVSEVTWQLGARPEEKPGAGTADEIELKKRFGANAQILSSPQAGNAKDQRVYFEDVSVELQKVLSVQLRKPGDVSAVIETPSGFLLYVAREKTSQTLAVTTLSLPKRSYEEWLSNQSGIKP